jgi:hypothetical protein
MEHLAYNAFKHHLIPVANTIFSQSMIMFVPDSHKKKMGRPLYVAASISMVTANVIAAILSCPKGSYLQ